MVYLRHLWEFVGFIYRRFNETEGLEASAAIAYYAIFSLFPLIVFLIAFNSPFLKSDEVRTQIIKITEQYLPGTKTLVEGNIKHLISGRRTVGIMGTVVLLWAASLVFAGIASNVNQAWAKAAPRHFLIDRLMGLAMVGFMILSVIISLLVTAIINLAPDAWALYRMGGPVLLRMSWAAKVFLQLAPFAGLFVALTLVYRWVPNTVVRWREALLGGFFATTMLEVTKTGFIWYLSSGLGSYQLIYGSLGAVVVFMLWIYLSATVVLLGAHVSAAVAEKFRYVDEEKAPA